MSISETGLEAVESIHVR